jgi:hypothetical protein
MVNPSKIKGDRFEWDLVNDASALLVPVGLEIERTKAGSERDLGDLHIRLPDRSVLAAVQAKNRRERKYGEWVDDAMRQAGRARARFGVLFVKRIGLANVLRSYAMMPVGEWLRLLIELHAAESALPEIRCPNCSATIRARMADAPPPLLTSDGLTAAEPITCDRCVPGVHGERIDVSTHNQLPCHHLTGPYPPYPAVRLGP